MTSHQIRWARPSEVMPNACRPTEHWNAREGSAAFLGSAALPSVAMLLRNAHLTSPSPSSRWLRPMSCPQPMDRLRSDRWPSPFDARRLRKVPQRSQSRHRFNKSSKLLDNLSKAPYDGTNATSDIRLLLTKEVRRPLRGGERR